MTPVFTPMLMRVTTKREVLNLISERGPLKDSQLAQVLGARHQQVNQAARGLEADGLVARVPGPDGVIRNHLKMPGKPSPRGRGSPPTPPRAAMGKPPPILGPVVVGTQISRDDLRQLDFAGHALQRVPSADVPEAGLIGWDTLGEVPRAPGLYCFVGEHGSPGDLRIFYVGMTTHLWMVTKGQLPGGVARGGQRYGRPKHAGETRRRVNGEVARMTADAWTFTHWLRAVEAPDERANIEALLRAEESRLIGIWELRKVGWNRA